MKKFLFELGTMKELCLAELTAVFGAQNVRHWGAKTAVVELEETGLEAKKIIARLGGTVKMAEILTEMKKEASEGEILTWLADYFMSQEQEKIFFAVSEIGRDHLVRFDLVKLKNLLQENGLKVRFNDRSRTGVGAALLLHNRKLEEIILAQGKTELLIARTVAVQDIDDWTLRDRGKPYADHKKGMLPPKLARIMVNLATGQAEMSKQKLYDPFCGTGTILLEAARENLTVIGSDLDVKAVFGSGENLEWLEKTYGEKLKYKTFTKDVTRVELGELGGKVDFIVTEPFLGRQTPKSHDLANIFRGLEKLYWGAFRHWQQLLQDEASVVIVFPRVRATDGKVYTLDKLLDKLEEIGYTKRSSGLIYARPEAVVEREICVFRFRKNSDN